MYQLNEDYYNNKKKKTNIKYACGNIINIKNC